MIVKVKESFEKTRHVKNNDKSKKYIVRGQRNEDIMNMMFSNKKKIYYVTYFCVDFFEEFYRYKAETFNIK